MEKAVKIVVTETYLDSLYKLKDKNVIIAIEKKVKKLLDNPDIAIPMKYQNEGFCEIKIGKKYRVYCIRREDEIIVFYLGVVLHHKHNYGNSQEYDKLFEKLRTLVEGLVKKKI